MSLGPWEVLREEGLLVFASFVHGVLPPYAYTYIIFPYHVFILLPSAPLDRGYLQPLALLAKSRDRCCQ